ncbi:DLW-39 family protein [Micrococcus sp. NPDC078436]|uniref:DLW-39 family protein n=1 Tax=Micrococcus sp. NPDC078436 TaxID=3154960 RepID=UPI00344F1403
MDRLARVALVAAAAAAAYGARTWRANREGKDIWASATDGLPESVTHADPAPKDRPAS